MKVMLIAYGPPEAFDLREDKARSGPFLKAQRDYAQALREAGALVQTAPLARPETATLVSLEGGRRCVKDGTVAPGDEQIGGLYVIDAPDMAAAVAWAAKSPAALRGRVEVRPIPDFGQGD